MAQPTRADALATIQEGQARLDELLSGLSDDDQSRTATIGGGDWSAKDLIGHIAFWEEIALETLEAWRRGEKPRVEETFTSGGTDSLNRWNYERKREWSVEKVRRESNETHRRLLEELASLTDEEWQSKAPFPTERRKHLRSELGAVLGAPKRPFGHAFAHIPDLEAYVACLR